jgi:hypothetical protein
VAAVAETSRLGFRRHKVDVKSSPSYLPWYIFYQVIIIFIGSSKSIINNGYENHNTSLSEQAL